MNNAANANKAIQAENNLATVKFPRAKFERTMLECAVTTALLNDSKETQSTQSYEMLKQTASFKNANPDVPAETIAESLVKNAVIIRDKIGASGEPCLFVETVEPKEKGGAVTYKWTGYGRNVISQCRQMLTYETPLAADYRKQVAANKAAKHEANKVENPAKALLAESVELIDELWKAIRNDVIGKKDQILNEDLATRLLALQDDLNAANKVQADIEAAAADEAVEAVAENA